MPTSVTTPPTGVKHSESATATALVGGEVLIALRPTAADSTKYENVNLPAILFLGDSVIYVDANGNIIIGGLNRSHSIAGVYNKIDGGQDCHIDNVDSSFNTIRDSDGAQILAGRDNSITSSRGALIEGGQGNSIEGGGQTTGCTIPASCSGVKLINCDGFTAPAGVSNVTYINNVLATGRGATRDLLEHTTDFMQAVMALTYTDCDAAPADSPAGSFPGQQFDAFDAQGRNLHFYCTRGTYNPAAPAGTTGVGPAWHYTVKLG